jgi:hypothetical protein
MKDQKCTGCGHKLSQHREYARGGVNRHGCRLVCIAEGCMRWTECHTGRAEGSLPTAPAAAGAESTAALTKFHSRPVPDRPTNRTKR